MSDIYNTQKELLDQINELEGTDIFIATYMATEQKTTGVVSSVTSWAHDVHSWLPVTESIAFGKGDGIVCVTPWKVAEEIVGDLMKPIDCYPKRVEVKEFPSDKQLEELKKFSEQ